MLRRALAIGLPLLDAIVELQIGLLASYQGDTLVARKLGPDASSQIRDRARRVAACGATRTAAGRAALAGLDLWLRRDGHRWNPGTTADLVTAVLFVGLLDGSIPGAVAS